MRRSRALFLNGVLILGLLIPGVVAGGFGSVAPPQAMAGAAPTNGETTDGVALAGKKAKRKHDRKQKHRKHARKHKRQHGRNEPGTDVAAPPVEVPTGILPGAENAGPEPDQGPAAAQGRYIIRLKSGTGDELATTTSIAAANAGVVATHVYRHVFPGFAAVIPPDKVDAVRNDPRVEAVMPDGIVYATEQVIPTGIRRIDTLANPTADINGAGPQVDVDVAIIDTAGNDTHEDLNIHAWADCTPHQQHQDAYGHGTHVGGTVGAIDNDLGVVGVAPGARLWNIRVLGNRGFGYDSWIICGLDLVTQYATPQGDNLGDIEVANLSLGGPGADSPDCGLGVNDLLHQAFCRAVDAGVTVVVAAGNEADNAALFTPGAYNEVITVSAMADSDGQPGGLGPVTWTGPDDTLADFSNFGADIDIAGPGVDILSTVPTGSCEGCDPSGYALNSGTSMASPHVAGAAALYLATHPGASPAQVKAALLASREQIALQGDPDSINEGVLNVGPGFSALATTAHRADRPTADSGQTAEPAEDKESKRAKSAKKPHDRRDKRHTS